MQRAFNWVVFEIRKSVSNTYIRFTVKRPRIIIKFSGILILLNLNITTKTIENWLEVLGFMNRKRLS